MRYGVTVSVASYHRCPSDSAAIHLYHCASILSIVTVLIQVSAKCIILLLCDYAPY